MAGLNCVKIWGEGQGDPYDVLIVEATMGGRIVVNTSDQLKFMFSPHFASVIYAPSPGCATYRLRRALSDFSISKLSVQTVPMTPAEHQRQKILSVIAPFGLPL